jgi:hypothetical protein
MTERQPGDHRGRNRGFTDAAKVIGPLDRDVDEELAEAEFQERHRPCCGTPSFRKT